MHLQTYHTRSDSSTHIYTNTFKHIHAHTSAQTAAQTVSLADAAASHGLLQMNGQSTANINGYQDTHSYASQHTRTAQIVRPERAKLPAYTHTHTRARQQQQQKAHSLPPPPPCTLRRTRGKPSAEKHEPNHLPAPSTHKTIRNGFESSVD